MPEPQALTRETAFGEQPRWHEDRLWFSDWGPPEVIAVDLEGNHEVVLRASSFPFVHAWLLGRRDPRPQSSMSRTNASCKSRLARHLESTVMASDRQ
jgi:hypothetical protein